MRTSALGAVYESIVAEFAADGEGTAVVFGKREPAKQLNQGAGRANRVVIEPVSGQSVGNFDAPRFPGGNPKPVGVFVVSPTIYVWAVDLTAPTNDRLQYEAITELLERVVRAIYHVAGGSFVLGAIKDVASKTERVFGCEWAFTLTLRETLSDVSETTATAVDETTMVLDSPGV